VLLRDFINRLYPQKSSLLGEYLKVVSLDVSKIVAEKAIKCGVKIHN
jgi:hypothetical protein